MEPEHIEAVWLTEDYQFSLPEFVELSGLSDAELRELVDYGTITPANPDASQWVFTEKCLRTVRTACHLRTSFDLEPHGMALLVSLLNRIHDLEAQLSDLRIQVPHRAR